MYQILLTLFAVYVHVSETVSMCKICKGSYWNNQLSVCVVSLCWKMLLVFIVYLCQRQFVYFSVFGVFFPFVLSCQYQCK